MPASHPAQRLPAAAVVTADAETAEAVAAVVAVVAASASKRRFAYERIKRAARFRRGALVFYTELEYFCKI